MVRPQDLAINYPQMKLNSESQLYKEPAVYFKYEPFNSHIDRSILITIKRWAFDSNMYYMMTVIYLFCSIILTGLTLLTSEQQLITITSLSIINFEIVQLLCLLEIEHGIPNNLRIALICIIIITIACKKILLGNMHGNKYFYLQSKLYAASRFFNYVCLFDYAREQLYLRVSSNKKEKEDVELQKELPDLSSAPFKPQVFSL